MEKNSVASRLLGFIHQSPAVFHVVQNIENRLEAEGFCRLEEHCSWHIKAGGKYFVSRNGSSILAFQIPKLPYHGFQIVASHSDCPCFKVKENPEIQGKYVSLNTERYGGMILSSWLDRPLSLAGRVVVKKEGAYAVRLVNVDQDLLVIPSVAPHLDKSANDGKKWNPQSDMLPLFSGMDGKNKLNKVIAKWANEEESAIVSQDLYLYNRQKGTLLGYEEEFISSPKLDDLQCVFSSLQGFLQARVDKSVAVLAVFDNEEVGSATKQGAGSPFLSDSLLRMHRAMGGSLEDYFCALAQSFMVSADNAHALHPNGVAFSDPTNQPVLNGGVVIKYNANQRYATDAIAAAIFKGMVEELGLCTQSYANRSDLLGGSTLGSISNTKVAIKTVDVGLPQLAMHSAWETGGCGDTEDFMKICQKFFSSTIYCQGDGFRVES